MSESSSGFSQDYFRRVVKTGTYWLTGIPMG